MTSTKSGRMRTPAKANGDASRAGRTSAKDSYDAAAWQAWEGEHENPMQGGVCQCLRCKSVWGRLAENRAIAAREN